MKKKNKKFKNKKTENNNNRNIVKLEAKRGKTSTD